MDEKMDYLENNLITRLLLTLRALKSHICDIRPLHDSECVPSITKHSKCL